MDNEGWADDVGQQVGADVAAAILVRLQTVVSVHPFLPQDRKILLERILNVFKNLKSIFKMGLSRPLLLYIGKSQTFPYTSSIDFLIFGDHLLTSQIFSRSRKSTSDAYELPA